MAKRKDLLLTEATTMRMMGLAGLKPLASSFLREQEDLPPSGQATLTRSEKEPPPERLPEGKMCECGGNMEEGMCVECGNMEEGYMDEEVEDFSMKDSSADEQECPVCGEAPCECEDDDEDDEEEDDEEEDDEEEDEEEYDEEDELDEYDIPDPSAPNDNIMQESINKRIKRLKRLLEQADAPPPPSAMGEEPPPAPEGAGGDEMESKIKEFVKKLGQLVQETLGVEVTVEEEGEEKTPEGAGEMPPPEGGAGMPPPPPMGAAGATTAPPAAQGMMQEAISRLVNKVARRVKARLMEAKKKEDLKGLEKHYGAEMRAGIKGKHSHKERMKALKEKQMAAKKKEMMMKKKKEEAMRAKKK